MTAYTSRLRSGIGNVNDRLNAAALISISLLKVQRLFQLRVKH